MIPISFVAVVVSLIYHLFFIFFGRSIDFDYSISLFLSGTMCLLGVLSGGLKKELLYPPRVLATLYLLFYPVYAAYYLAFPEVGKWYHQYFWLHNFNQDVAWTVFYVTITLPIFQFGFYRGLKSGWGNRRVPSIAESQLPLRRINKIMIMATCIGVVGMLMYANSLGGIDNITQSMGDIVERKNWRGQASLGYYPGMFLMTAPAISLLTALYEPKYVSRKLIILGLSLFAIALPVLVLTQAAREKALIPFVLVLLSMYYFQKRKGKTSLFNKRTLAALLLCTILSVVFLVHSAIRHQEVTSRPFHIQMISDFNRIDVSVVMYFDFLKNDQSYLYGKPFLSYIVQPFVRFFDVDPIANTSAILGRSIFTGEDYGNPGAPLAGELYVNFGFLGYFVFVLSGYLFGVGYRVLVKSHFEFWTTLSYVLWLYLFMFKFCIQIGISESLLFAGILVGQLWIFRWLSNSSQQRMLDRETKRCGIRSLVER